MIVTRAVPEPRPNRCPLNSSDALALDAEIIRVQHAVLPTGSGSSAAGQQSEDAVLSFPSIVSSREESWLDREESWSGRGVETEIVGASYVVAALS